MDKETLKNSEKEDNSLDISTFFSRDNEEEGKWYEPEVKGKKAGFELRIYGPNSQAVALADEGFQIERDKLENDKNLSDTEKAKQFKELVIKRFTKYICDIRGKDGRKLLLNGKPVTKEDIPTLIENSPVIALDVSKFATKQDNFLDFE